MVIPCACQVFSPDNTHYPAPVRCFHLTADITRNYMNENHIFFFTATIVEWKHLLKPDKYKQLIVDSLKYLVSEQKIVLYAYVIMPNNIHVLWRIIEPNELSAVKRDFLKFCSQNIKFDLEKNHPNVLELFKSNRKDRKYQFWQDRSYNTPLHNRNVVVQKLEYIHNNPLSKNWKLVSAPEEYFYSSAAFYLKGNVDNDFITHYIEET